MMEKHGSNYLRLRFELFLILTLQDVPPKTDSISLLVI